MIKQPEVYQFGMERFFVHLPFRKRLVVQLAVPLQAFKHNCHTIFAHLDLKK
jgi:hypothetical protein